MSLLHLPLLLLLLALGLPSALACLYLLIQTLMSAPLPDPPRSLRQLRFDIIVPAHNEAAVICTTIASLRRIDWPADRFRILVIADNCSDDTAALARAAGASILERFDNTLRGKGYALRAGFERSRNEAWADAVAVVDADAEVSGNLLEACAARLEHGAHAVQVHYGVLNPWGSWRTRLLTVAMAAYHVVGGGARARASASASPAASAATAGASRIGCWMRSGTTRSRWRKTSSTGSRSGWPAIACTTPARPMPART
jgi:cellulose synthase/poly-beta-1,6-N-acetylglucosamine synthase-like glycosyltransferase